MLPERRPLRVLHTGDVHLGSDGYGDAARRAAHQERIDLSAPHGVRVTPRPLFSP